MSQTTFQVTARRTESGIELCIEDDAPGIPEGARDEALRSGSRLDTSVRGTGLGLSISVDLLAAYVGKLELRTSERLGGLACEVTLRM
ncbi:ATP-binding protein [Ruegeria sp. SCPT10]|uniref:ATP-binding protein n=1 Tax=Ruegeria sp. SCP10 TaxID=3141377 RepID=UPI003334D7B2